MIDNLTKSAISISAECLLEIYGNSHVPHKKLEHQNHLIGVWFGLWSGSIKRKKRTHGFCLDLGRGSIQILRFNLIILIATR